MQRGFAPTTDHRNLQACAAANICEYRSSYYQHMNSKAATPKQINSYRARSIFNVALRRIKPARTSPEDKVDEDLCTRMSVVCSMAPPQE